VTSHPEFCDAVEVSLQKLVGDQHFMLRRQEATAKRRVQRICIDRAKWLECAPKFQGEANAPDRPPPNIQPLVAGTLAPLENFGAHSSHSRSVKQAFAGLVAYPSLSVVAT